LPAFGKPTMPHLKPMDQSSLTCGSSWLSALVQPSGKIIGDSIVGARDDGIFGSWRPFITQMRRRDFRRQ
jgi:hypothetical protein